MNMRCKTCQFFDGYRMGVCRRRSPIVSIVPEEVQQGGHTVIMFEPKTAWPGVFETDWCGDYKEK